jgi:hypothetical protein
MMEELDHIKYIKVRDRAEAEQLGQHYNDLMWVSVEREELGIYDWDKFLSAEKNFPFLLEYNDYYNCKQVGSYLNCNQRYTERSLTSYYVMTGESIDELTICTVPQLFRILNYAEKYYVLL